MWTKIRLKFLDERGDFAEDIAGFVVFIAVLCLGVILVWATVDHSLEQKKIEERRAVIVKNLEQDFPGIDFEANTGESPVFFFAGPSDQLDLCKLDFYGYDSVNPVGREANMDEQEGECRKALDVAREKATAPVG